MVLPDTYLNEVAKAMAGEVHVTPTHYGFSPTLTTVDVSDTSMAGESGLRTGVTMARNENVITYSAVKTGAIVSTSGEDVKGIGSFSASTAGTLMTETVVPTINHTNSFDIEFITEITYSRQ